MVVRIIKLPDIGEGIAEAEVAAWHVKVGDVIREDQPLADLMTDKATLEIPSPVAGTVVALGAESGTVMAVGSELLRLEVADGDAPVPSASVPSVPVPSAPDASDVAKTVDAGTRTAVDAGPPPRPAEAPAPPQGPAPGSPFVPRPPVPPGPPRPEGGKPTASPAVRRRALEAGADLRRVRGTGPAGRIGHDDLDAYLAADAAPAGAVGPVRRAADTTSEAIKVVGLRRRIAQRMAEASRRVAHFSYVEEVDVTALEDLRTTLNARFGESRARLTLIPFLVAALVRALPDFPGMNAHYDDEAEIVHRYGGVHVGIATQTPAGLTVPVLRHAETLSLWDCAAEVGRLADAARGGVAKREELSGSTITITSLGKLGGLVTTPVMNRPEVAILGVNKQVMRPLWRDGTFVPRLTMNLSSSFDHRVVDGYDAARFVQALKGLLESPALLLVDP